MALTSVSEDIRTLLNDNGKGVAGTDLFSFQWGSGDNGEEVDKQIMVRHDEDIDAIIKDEYEQPTFNILVRGDTNEGVKSVYDRARDIYEFLRDLPRQTIGGNEYLEFAPVGGLISLGKDRSNRFVYSMTFFSYRNAK